MNYEQALPKEVNVFSFLQQISGEISESLSKAERVALPDVISLVAKIYQDLEIETRFIDINNPDAITRATVAISLAYSWLEKHSSFPDLKEISDQILLLFLDKDRTYVEEDETASNASLHENTGRTILKAAFPDLDLDWENTSYTDTLRKLEELSDEDGIVRLPFSVKSEMGRSYTSEAFEFLKSVYEVNPQIPKEQHKRFLGFFNPESGVVVLWKDSPQSTEIHEKLHADNIGLLAGDLGYVLNEGMTEMLTHRRLMQDGATSQDIALIRAGSKYMRSVQLVEVLDEVNPQLGEGLLRLYQSPQVEDARFVSTELIRMLGLNMYARLYTALPKEKDEADILYFLKSLKEPKQEDTDKVPEFTFDL